MTILDIYFAYPIMLLMPLIFAFFSFKRVSTTAVPYPSLQSFENIKISLRVKLRGPVLKLLKTLVVISLSIAAARPQRILFSDSSYDRRNLMLAIDLSRSMGAADFSTGFRSVTRLGATKGVVSEFLDNRIDDRIGVVVFGAKAYVQAPLTTDHILVKELISRLEVGIAGDGTAIGDGVALALKRMKDIQGVSKAIILVTDGASNAGQLEPLTTAKIAAELKIKIHTIGIGTNADTLAINGLFQGNSAAADFDEKTLKQMAAVTGGVYFHASDLEGLKNVYSEIDKLERSQQIEPARRRVDELFWPWAMFAMLTASLLIVLSSTLFLKVP